jgi:hypothetical protein
VLHDPRDPRRIEFSYQDLLQQRVFQISAGYEEANDSRHDPIFKLLLNRLPETAEPMGVSPPETVAYQVLVKICPVEKRGYRAPLALL